MRRPADWSPLRGSDPVPGDPDAVADSARHARDVASELREQVRRLKRISGETALKGRYADRLRDAADELVGDLEQVERRYTRVAAALRSWEPQLRTAQGRADGVRRRGKVLDEERRSLQRQAAGTGLTRLSPTATPAETAAYEADVAAAAQIRERFSEVEREIGQLRDDLGRVEDEVREDGRAVARQIEAASDDDIKDTRWEDVKGAAGKAWRAVDAFVDRHVEVLKKAVELLELAVLALAVVAIFIPGINLAVLLIAGAVVLGAQTVMYTTGNGSLVDVGLAVFGLLTLGTGALATRLLKGARAASLRAAAPHAGNRAAASARASTQQARQRLGDRLGRNLTPGQRATTRAELDQLQARTAAEAHRRSARATAGYQAKPLMQASRLQALRNGDLTNARYLNDIARTRRQFPLPDVVQAGRWADPAMHLARGSFFASAASDVSSKIAGESALFPGKPYSHSYERFKDSWERP